MNQTRTNTIIPGLVILLASITAIGPFAIDTNLPAIPIMAEFFHVSPNTTQLTVSIFLIGFAVGQIIGGPLSDRVGRKPMAYIGLSILAISSFIIAFSSSIHMVLSFRFIQAIGGGFTTVLTGAIVRDKYEGRTVARMMSLIGTIMLAAPLIAPAVGTFLLIHFGWKSIFIFLGLYAIVLLVLVTFFLKESNLYRKKGKGSILTALKNYRTVIKNKFAFSCILAGSLTFAGMFAFITRSSVVYIDYYKIPLSQFPYFFGANVILMILFTYINSNLVKYHSPLKLLKIGQFVLLTVITIMWITVEFFSPDVYTFLIMMLIVASCLGFISGNAVGCALQQFPKASGTANALNGVIEYSAGGLTGFLISLFDTGDLRILVIIMFACMWLAFLPMIRFYRNKTITI
ncbi:MAG: multidrug effflux MFS transporter [Hyphomicrobiales bacterium]